MTYIKAIVAVSENGIIGHEGRIPWYVPEDLAHFKRETQGRTVVVGRKTLASLPPSVFGKNRNGRRWIILSGQSLPGVEARGSVEAVLGTLAPDEDLIVAGGAETYLAFGRLIDEWVISRIPVTAEGDVRFPEEFVLTGFKKTKTKVYPWGVVEHWGRIS